MSVAAQEPDLEGPSPGGLRHRKKERTGLAIQDAALDLIVSQGFEATTVDQIAARAEVSKATFFRYFASKGAVIFGREGYELDGLRAAILRRPPSEPDLVAAHRALRDDWLPTVDPDRIERQTRAAATSPLLRGLSFDLGVQWQDAIAEALAERRGLPAPDGRCRLRASLVFTGLSIAVNQWVYSGGGRDLGVLLDDAFSLLTDVCREVGTAT